MGRQDLKVPGSGKHTNAPLLLLPYIKLTASFLEKVKQHLADLFSVQISKECPSLHVHVILVA